MWRLALSIDFMPRFATLISLFLFVPSLFAQAPFQAAKWVSFPISLRQMFRFVVHNRELFAAFVTRHSCGEDVVHGRYHDRFLATQGTRKRSLVELGQFISHPDIHTTRPICGL